MLRDDVWQTIKVELFSGSNPTLLRSFSSCFPVLRVGVHRWKVLDWLLHRPDLTMVTSYNFPISSQRSMSSQSLFMCHMEGEGGESRCSTFHSTRRRRIEIKLVGSWVNKVFSGTSNLLWYHFGQRHVLTCILNYPFQLTRVSSFYKIYSGVCHERRWLWVLPIP